MDARIKSGHDDDREPFVKVIARSNAKLRNDPFAI
jgi:hypothetical protein